MDEQNIVDNNSLVSEGLSIQERIYSEVRREYCRLFGSVPSGSISELSLLMLLCYLALHRRMGWTIYLLLSCPLSFAEMLIISTGTKSQQSPKYFRLIKKTLETTLELRQRFPIALTTLTSFIALDSFPHEDSLYPIVLSNLIDNRRDNLDLTQTDNYTAKAQSVFCTMSNFQDSIDPVDLVLRAFKHVTTENIDLEATKSRLEISREEIDFSRGNWLASERFVVARLLKQRIIQEGVDAWYRSQPELIGELLSRIVFDLDLHREHYCLEYGSVKDALYTITKKDDLYNDHFKPHLLNLVRNYGEGNEQSIEFAFRYLSEREEEELIEIVKEADKLGEEHPHDLAVGSAVRRLQETYPDRFPEKQYVEYRKRRDELKREGFCTDREELLKAVFGKGYTS